MADKPETDWSGVTGEAVERLRAPKVTPVPEPIVKAAQRSWDGVEKNGKKLHAMRHEFATEEQAKEFARLVKKAQDHTIPRTTVTAVIDPDHGLPNHECNNKLVAWEARNKRARTTANA
jgi:hypothetical protein